MSTYNYYTKFRKTNNAFTVTIHDVQDRSKIIMIFNDSDVFQDLPKNLGNYFSWAIQIKKYLKILMGDPNNGLKQQIYNCTFYSNYNTEYEKRYHAEIIMDLRSNKDIDGTLWQ